MKNKTIEPDALCGFCRKPIYLKDEVYGTLFTSRGTPICAVCRVLRKPPEALLKIRVDQEDKEQKVADNKMMELAIKSQEEAEKKSKKKKSKKKTP